MKKIITYMHMSRMSNLPTVWSNCVVGMFFYDFAIDKFIIISVLCSLYYIAGMILNDVCDYRIDQKERPERPIPSQKISHIEAMYVAIFLLAIAMCGSYCLIKPNIDSVYITIPILLPTAIIIYNLWHKGNIFSPFIMASCRFFVYILAALTVTKSPESVLYLGCVGASYIVGLTYLAMQENLAKIRNIWPTIFIFLPFFYAFYESADIYVSLVSLIWVLSNIRYLYKKEIKKGISGFISGVCLVDAMLITTYLPCGLPMYLCLIFFVFTIITQKFISGT